MHYIQHLNESGLPAPPSVNPETCSLYPSASGPTEKDEYRAKTVFPSKSSRSTLSEYFLLLVRLYMFSSPDHAHTHMKNTFNQTLDMNTHTHMLVFMVYGDFP